MIVRITYQNGSLTIDLGGNKGAGAVGGSGGDSPIGGSGGDSPIGSGVGGASFCGGLVLGPIVIPMQKSASHTGGSGGDSPIGGSGGDSPIGSGSGGTHNCCCPTIIGPIVFTDCCSGSSSSTTPTLTSVDIKSVLPSGTGLTSGPRPEGAFELQSQQEAQWCWAAVTVSVNDFLDVQGTWTQKKLVEKVLGTVCDLVPNPNDHCDQAYNLDGPLAVTGNLHKPTGAKFDQFVTFADLQAYWTVAQLPICVRIAWDDGSERAHFIVITGCTELSDGTQMVTVYDPSPLGFGPAQWEYDTLRANYMGPGGAGVSGGKGHWSDTYFVQP